MHTIPALETLFHEEYALVAVDEKIPRSEVAIWGIVGHEPRSGYIVTTPLVRQNGNYGLDRNLTVAKLQEHVITQQAYGIVNINVAEEYALQRQLHFDRTGFDQSRRILERIIFSGISSQLN